MLTRVCLVLLVASSAVAATLNVPADYATIQAAMVAAVNGDEVVVAAGTYHETVDFLGKAVRLRSTNPLSAATVAATIIHGDDLRAGVRFMAGETAAAVLEGFTITHCLQGVICSEASPTIARNVLTLNRGYVGGAITCSLSSARIEGNVISDNEVVDSGPFLDDAAGGGIYTVGGAPVICGNTITGNESAQSGGGVHCFGGAVIRNNDILLNTALDGGGVFTSGTPEVVVEGNTIAANTAAEDGGGIKACDAFMIRGNDIRGNTAEAGGGVYCYPVAETSFVEGNQISSNTVEHSGGGLFLARGMTNVTGNRVSNNDAGNEAYDGLGAGGGITCAEHAVAALANDVIDRNAADYAGGGIACSDGSTTTVTNCTLDGNSAREGDGGGIVFREDAVLTVTNCIITWSSGGGILRMPGSSATPTVSYCNLYSNVPGNFGGFAPAGPGYTTSNPLYANRSGGDYHLKSQAGRWNPSTGSWVSDTVTSPCIDTGDPASPFGDEPAPNGGRINMGAYGNTSQASKTYALDPLATPGAPCITAVRKTTDATQGVATITHSPSDPGACTGYRLYLLDNGVLPADERASWVQIATIAATGKTTYTHTRVDLNAGRSYRFGVRAYKSSRTSALVTCILRSPNVTPRPPGLSAARVATDATQANVTVAKSLDDPLSCSDYRIERKADIPGLTIWTQIAVIPATNSATYSFRDTGLTGGGYHYRARAHNGSRRSTPVDCVLRDLSVTPRDPGIAAVRVAGDATRANVTVTRSADDPAGVEYYAVYRRSTSPLTSFAEVARIVPTGATSYALTDTRLTAGTPYRYGVRAFNGTRTSGLVTCALADAGGASALVARTTAAATKAGGAQIVVTLTTSAAMSVEVLNIAGRTVRRVCADRVGTAGMNVVLWDGRSDAGTRVPSGKYLVRVTARKEDGQQSHALAAMVMGR